MKRQSSLVLLCCFLLLSTASPSFATAPQANLRAPKESAVDLAMKTFEKFRSKVTSLSMECLDFREDDTPPAESDADVTVEEKHGGKCGGDPDTAPTVAMLRVKGKKVYILDSMTGDYRLFNKKWKPTY